MEEQRLGPGIKIIGFNSLEEILAYQAEKEAEVQAMPLLPEQEAITWGDYAVQVVGDEQESLMIYGHIYTEDEYVRLGIEAGGNSDEMAYELAHLHETYARGYRYGEWYSTAAPKGDLGDVHISAMWPISKSIYLAAQAEGWPFSVEIARKMVNEVRASIARVEAGDD